MLQARTSQDRALTETLIKQRQLVAEKIFWFSIPDVQTLTTKKKEQCKKSSRVEQSPEAEP